MIIQMSQVTKRYGRKIGVENISLTLHPGEVIGLIGLNGSGKTTTLKLLSGLLRPSSGEVVIDGGSPRKRRGKLAFHSELDTLYPWLDHKGAAFFMKGLYPDFDVAKFYELIEILEVPTGPSAQMSKGQKSRFKLSLTLARKAGLFLLDEPLSGIDVISRKKIMETLVKEWRQEASMVISTHEIEIAQTLFDRVIILHKGQIVLDDSAEALRSGGRNIVDVFEEAIT